MRLISSWSARMWSAPRPPGPSRASGNPSSPTTPGSLRPRLPARLLRCASRRGRNLLRRALPLPNAGGAAGPPIAIAIRYTGSAAVAVPATCTWRWGAPWESTSRASCSASDCTVNHSLTVGDHLCCAHGGKHIQFTAKPGQVAGALRCRPSPVTSRHSPGITPTKTQVKDVPPSEVDRAKISW